MEIRQREFDPWPKHQKLSSFLCILRVRTALVEKSSLICCIICTVILDCYVFPMTLYQKDVVSTNSFDILPRKNVSKHIQNEIILTEL